VTSGRLPAPLLRAVHPLLAARQTRRSRGFLPGDCHGAVTAEFAVTLPAVLLLLAVLLAGSAAGVTQLRLEEAARAGARALARGEGAGAVEGIVRQLAGPSVSATVTAEGDWLRVAVSGRVPGPVGSMIPWTLSARALARSETPQSAAVRQEPATLFTWQMKAAA
jgi:TadE-like protein